MTEKERQIRLRWLIASAHDCLYRIEASLEKVTKRIEEKRKLKVVTND